MRDALTSSIVPTDSNDLILTRVVDVPAHLLWQAYTRPEHLPHWWCPLPYRATVIEMDVRPGGAFTVQMHAPDGSNLPLSPGCYLEVVENQRITFTSALSAGFRPVTPLRSGDDCHSFPFTAIITFDALAPNSTRYTARGLHANEADRRKHEAMGFHEGWGAVLDQLVRYIKTHLM